MASGKAVVINAHGGIDKFEIVDSFAVRAPQAGELLLKNVAASVNPVDTYVRSGMYPASRFPTVVGGDFAGVVHAAPAGSKFAVGDAVFGLSPTYLAQPELDGCYAEYVLVKEEWVAKIPQPSLDFVNAAAVPLVALTAWQALEKARPQAGQRVFVTGASGGVGMFAVQLAKRVHHLHVVALASAKHFDWLKQYGADEVFDYSTGVAAVVEAYKSQPFDIIIDVIGGELVRELRANVLKPEGVLSYVHNRGTISDDLAQFAAESESKQGPRFEATLVQPHGEQMNQIADMFARGELQVKVAAVLPLEKAGEAHELVITGHAGGKIVLTL